MSNKNTNSGFTFDEAHARIGDAWPDLLAALGVDASTLKNKLGPCPGCGGKDRFRFDNKDGRGSFYCNKFGAGDGFKLLQHVHGWKEAESLKRVAEWLGIGPDVGGRANNDADLLAAKERRAARERTDAEAAHKARQATAVEAAKLWQQATPPPFVHAYLERKQVQAFGVRVLGDDVLIPLCDNAGKLCTLERIAANTTSPGPAKRLLKGAGTVTGNYHLIGNSDALRAPGALLFVAEGYSTAASVHMATGQAVAVAVNANNLLPAARNLRARFPDARIVLAADNDHHHGTDNKGLSAAQAAAKACAGVVMLPAPLPGREAVGTDWNDVHAAAGLDAVANAIRTQLQAPASASVDADTAAKSAPHATTKTPTSEPATPRAGISPRDASKSNVPKRKAATAAADASLFTLTDSGLWFTEHNDAQVFVCDWLEAYALTRDRKSDGWLLCVRFRDRDGALREADVISADLVADGVEPVKALVNSGLRVAGTKGAKHLMTYLRMQNPSERLRTVYALGWHEFGAPGQPHDKRPRAFLWPDGHVSGDYPEQLRLHASVKQLNPAAVGGSLNDWQREIAALCAGNSRLVFGVCCAFAAPMMSLLERATVGFNIFGETSRGKSTTAHVAASVFGRPKDPERGDYLQSWRSTDNGMEAIARAFSGFVLAIDELKQIAPHIVQDAVYMLGNERAKARATVTGDARALATWRLLYLSTGELTVRAHMAEANKKPDAGVGVRLIELPCDPGKGLGLFDTLHDFASGAALSDRLKVLCGRYYGSAGRAFVNRLCAEWSQVTGKVRDGVRQFVSDHVPDTAAPEVSRVADAFGVVAQAGELATRWGITGWAEHEATGGAAACFRAWLEYRGGTGNTADMDGLRQFAAFLSAGHESRFSRLERAKGGHGAHRMDDHSPRTVNALDWAEFDTVKGEDVYYFTPSGFAEACKGHDTKRVAKLLRERGMLYTGSAKGHQTTFRPPGQKSPLKVYAVSAKAMFAADQEDDNPTDAPPVEHAA